MTIDIYEEIERINKEISDNLRDELTLKGITSFNILGAPGIGKTSCLVEISKRVGECFVIEGDVEGDYDTVALNNLGIKTIQIDTHGACHLDSPQVKDAINGLNIEKGLIFIENIGNLICPAEFEIGTHKTILITSVTDGSDKPYKYPLAFQKADLLLINKNDLLPYVDFDIDFFTKGVNLQNKKCQIIPISCKTGEGFERVAQWILANAVKLL